MRRALGRVVAVVEESVLGLRELRAQEPKWAKAFQAVSDIALAPTKHLMRPHLVLVGFAAARGVPSLDVMDRACAPGAEEELLKREEVEGVVQFAAGVELQHLFMFVHDDLMDNAFTRRGTNTIQVAIANRSGEDNRFSDIPVETVKNLTTLVGDVLQAKSCELLHCGELSCLASGSGPTPRESLKKSATSAIMQGGYSAGAAQFDDILGWTGVERAIASEVETQESVLLRLLNDKASHHSFGAPLIAGIRLGSGHENTEELERAVKTFVRDAGAAYQALDDVLDFVMDASESGKDKLQDIREGRLSLPLFLLRQRATDEEWLAVYSILGNACIMTPSERHMLLKLIEKYQLINASLEFANDKIARAQETIGQEPIVKVPVMVEGLAALLEGLRNRSEDLRSRIKG